MVVLNGSWSYIPSQAEFVLMVVVTLIIEYALCVLLLPRVKGVRYWYFKVFVVVLFVNFISGLLGYWVVYF